MKILEPDEAEQVLSGVYGERGYIVLSASRALQPGEILRGVVLKTTHGNKVRLKQGLRVVARTDRADYEAQVKALRRLGHAPNEVLDAGRLYYRVESD